MAVPKMTTDPYDVLGIPNDAAPAAIRSSYKKLILQCHPDKVHDESLREEKAVQFQKVQEAYELLIDSRRRRKYDEELVNQAKAAAEAAAKPPQPPHTTHPHSPNTHPQHPHGTRSASGPVPGSAERPEKTERTERPGRRERSGTNPSPDERQRDKEKEREARHARKRERKSREESSWSPEEQSSRKTTQAEYWEADEARKVYEAQAHAHAHAHARHPDEVPRKGYNRYAEESPRKASYDARQYETPPMAPPPPTSELRPGYVEAKKVEEEKLAKLRARMAEETINVPRSSVAEETMRQAMHAEAMHAEVLRAAAAERVRLNKLEMERREREIREREIREREMRERAEMRSSRDRDRGTEIPPHRERRSSKTPPLRRGSSVTSRCDEPPSTPMMRPQSYGPPAPPHSSYPGTHTLNTGRRNSSPSAGKPASRMPSREAPIPCDSGYSSPSTDTPVTDKKVPGPEMQAAAEGIDPRTGPWKKYTFEVYVREDAEALAQAKGGIPSHHARRQPGSTSPSIHPADLSGGPPPPLPAEYIPNAAGIHRVPCFDPHYVPSPSSTHPRSPPSSHHPHSPHSSPPRSHRHHHSPNHSPRLGSEQFSPGLPRANTVPYYSHSSHSREREHSYSGYVPSLGRSSTFSG